MVLQNLDRHQWKFDEAVEHVAAVISVSGIYAEEKVPEPTVVPPWKPLPDPMDRFRSIAHTELLVALRDGDLHAKGRLSTHREHFYDASSTGWTLHSGHYEPVAQAHWLAGEFRRGRLTFLEGEFIDIQLPRFIVRTIWPEPQPESPPVQHDVEYSTPYLDLLRAAIIEFRISDVHQPKKDNLVDWFRSQKVEGEPLSENLASAMATLVRLPASQRGGAKRMW